MFKQTFLILSILFSVLSVSANEQQWLVGDVNHDRYSDVLQTFRGWQSIPICAWSPWIGWDCSNPAATIYDSGSWEQSFLNGDFNGDRRTDVIQTYRGWGSIPLCTSNSSSWSCSNNAATIYNSGSWEQKFLAGDFDGDGKDDVFQTWRSWGSIPVCLSSGSSWNCSNPAATIYNSGSWEQQFLTGDFNGDGKTDVAQVFRGWSSIPVCLSNGTGWDCSNYSATIYNSGSWEQKFITGDFDGDGKTDIAQTWRGWSSIPVCSWNGGGWNCSNNPATIYDSGSWEQQFLAGDFNHDGVDDVVQTYRGWQSIPLCLSSGWDWECSNLSADIYDSGSWEQKFLVGDINRDGRADVLQAYRGWSSYPACMNYGSNWFCANAPATIYNAGP
jgi:hypothetical protein